MAKALSVPPPSSFTIAGESVSALSQKWTTWLSRFNIYAAAAGISDDSQKRSLLLHIAGPEVQKVFDTLTDTGTRFDEALNKLIPTSNHAQISRSKDMYSVKRNRRILNPSHSMWSDLKN